MEFILTTTATNFITTNVINVQIRYIVKNNEIKEIRCLDKIDDCYDFNEIYIPDSFTGKNGKTYPITSIGHNVFTEGCLKKGVAIGTYQRKLFKLIISDKIENIQAGAFNYAFGLYSVKWPLNCKTIPRSCFSFCKLLTSIDGIQNVTTIEDSAFYATGFNSFVWPENCINIPNQCFEGCDSLSDIVINTPIVSIGNRVFYGTNLKKFDASKFALTDLHLQYDTIPKTCEIVYPFYHI